MLSPRQARRLILAAAVISGGIALIFSVFGAWPVLPFAGIEIGALWLALRHLQRCAGDEERIDVDETTIRVTRRSEDRCDQDEFSRYWARLRVEKSPGRQTIRLFLRSHGRETEIGRLLTDTQKIGLEKDLRDYLGT
jgi:uncharacterized membrane protein